MRKIVALFGGLAVGLLISTVPSFAQYDWERSGARSLEEGRRQTQDQWRQQEMMREGYERQPQQAPGYQNGYAPGYQAPKRESWVSADPRQQRRDGLKELSSFGSGYWRVGTSKQPGDCYLASYASSNGIVTVHSDGSVSMIGPDVPVDGTAARRLINVVVVPPRGSPIRTVALTAPIVPMVGGLKLGVKTPFDPEMLFSTDRVSIRVLSNKRIIFAVDLTGGLKVRDKIRQCKQLSGQLTWTRVFPVLSPEGVEDLTGVADRRK